MIFHRLVTTATIVKKECRLANIRPLERML